MNKIKEVDVLIIGAGPAGSIAAREASKNGAKTLIIDKKSEIGTPKRCGEGIMDGVLEKVGIEADERWIARHIDGARLVAPDNTSAWFTSENLETPATGIILERKVFDKHVTMDAIRSGAEVMIKTEAKNITRKEDYLLVDITSFDNEYSQIKAKIVIGADGPEGRVASWIGINTKVPLAEMESGAQYEMTNLKMEKNDTIEFYFGSVAPGGYAWIFPKGYDTANVGIDVSGIKGEKTALEYLDDFIANNEETKDGQIVEVNVGGNPLCGIFDKIIADNFMLVGDAAGCVSPITGGGIDTGLESGMIAGQVAAKAIKEDNLSEENLQEYADYVNENIGKKFEKLITVRDFIYNLEDEDMNEYIGAIAKANITKLSTKALLKAMIKVSPRKLLKLRKLL
ncbi:MAG: NAD(P)/FAD-dependent oxidoreductase [Methanosphaera stadtmanae]|nr:NAD(P)/FAD-dependent oxidoreductase [Methanosphaera stadtmanae]